MKKSLDTPNKTRYYPGIIFPYAPPVQIPPSMNPFQRNRPRRRTKTPSADLARRGSALLARLASSTKTYYGVQVSVLKINGADGYQKTRYYIPGHETVPFETPRKAVLYYLNLNTPTRQHGRWRLTRTAVGWKFGQDDQNTFFLERPTRDQLAAAIREFRRNDSAPSFNRPDHLGWRTWSWDRQARRLKSGIQNTIWETPELIVPHWDESEVVRGRAGIHACRLPRGDWRLADRPRDMPHGVVLGLVERFGRYVLGREGWRAEWVIIREFLAPNAAIASTLRKLYPEVVVHIAHRDHWLNHQP